MPLFQHTVCMWLHATACLRLWLHATACLHRWLHATAACRHRWLHATACLHIWLRATACLHRWLHATACLHLWLHATACLHMCLQVTLASDVYSFGVLMWLLYTGQEPFVHRAGMWLPNTLFPRFPTCAPPQYVDLVRSCLRKDPHERPTFPELTASLVAFFNEVLGPEGSHVPMPAPATFSAGMQASITGAPAAPSSRFAMTTDGSVAQFGLREDRMLAESFLASRSLAVASSLPRALASTLPPASWSLSHPQPSGASRDRQQQQSGSSGSSSGCRPPQAR